MHQILLKEHAEVEDLKWALRRLALETPKNTLVNVLNKLPQDSLGYAYLKEQYDFMVLKKLPVLLRKKTSND